MGTILTNKYDLPEIFMKACMVDNHRTLGDISTTQLIDAPQVRYLKAKNDIEQDVSEMIWMLFGTATHEVLERAEINHFQARRMLSVANILRNFEDKSAEKVADWLRKQAQYKFPEVFESKDLIEKIFTIEVAGMKISGTIDKYVDKDKELNDYKVTGGWSYVYEEARKKWYAQLNVYAYMLRQHGYPVESAYVVALFKDWSKWKMTQSKDYPTSAVMKVPVELYTDKQMVKYLTKRVELHRRAEAGDVEPCNGKERWAKSEMWAVMKKNAKNALSLCPSPETADKYMFDNQFTHDGMFVEYRPGIQKRCQEFCPVREVCPQWAELKKKIKK